jgi:hypothetical protein
MATYQTRLDDGSYEYGECVQERVGVDRLVPWGVAPTYAASCSALGIKPAVRTAPPEFLPHPEPRLSPG